MYLFWDTRYKECEADDDMPGSAGLTVTQTRLYKTREHETQIIKISFFSLTMLGMRDHDHSSGRNVSYSYSKISLMCRKARQMELQARSPSAGHWRSRTDRQQLYGK